MRRSTRNNSIWISFLLGTIFLGSCAHKARVMADPTQSMRLSPSAPEFSDDLDRASLIDGLRAHIAHFSGRPSELLQFGPRSISTHDYARSLSQLLMEIEKSESSAWTTFIKENFEFYEVFGAQDWADVFMTSYFAPLIRGSLKPTRELSRPLYALPDDLVVIRMNDFFEKYPALESIRSQLPEQRSGGSILRGRYSKGGVGGATGQIFPYYDRAEIDSHAALKGRKLELVYVDPVDAFVLQIQGSGSVLLPDGGTLKVGYASQNGHPYVAVGKFLTDFIPLNEMSLQKIERHLRSLPASEAQEYMNKNPSYVFFQKNTQKPITSLGTEVIDGRTIATDATIFPKGALAFLQFDKPKFNSPEDEVPTEWIRSQRLVFDQDTGGAIRGPARLDLFWGKGPEAKQAAGVMKNRGKLYYLAPKK